MELHLHAATRRRVERSFTVGIAPSSRRKLTKELERCDLCAEHYRRCQALESALTGSSNSVTPFALERVEASVLEAVAERMKDRPLWLPRRPLVAAGAVAAVTMMTMTLVLLVSRPDTQRIDLPSRDRLVPIDLAHRGGPQEESSRIGIRLFRVAEHGEISGETRKLGLDDIITFSYTYAYPKPGYLILFGVQREGEVLWYYPDYGGRQSIPIAGEKVDEPLGHGIKLSVNHSPGLLRITALFTTEPVAVETIESRVITLVSKGGTVEDLPLSPEQMGVPGIYHTLLVDISDGAD